MKHNLANSSPIARMAVLSAAKATPRKQYSRFWGYMMAGCMAVCFAAFMFVLYTVFYVFTGW